MCIRTSALGALLLASVLVAACAPAATPTPTPTPDYVAELVRTVERDGIEAKLAPMIVAASSVEASFDPTEPVLVTSINGEERAYSVAQLGIHEVVNDTLGGVPIAVTW
jgi:hypothetical protein